MKKICIILIALVFGFMLQACSVTNYPTTQDDIYTEVSIDEVDITGMDMNVVIRYGRPHYYSGSILYYLYDGIYYYPYYYNNYWYFRAYRRPFPYTHARPYFRPHRYDYRFHQGYVAHRNWYYNQPTRRGNRYDRSVARPNQRPNFGRPATRPNNSRPDVRPNVVQPNQRPTTMRPNTQTPVQRPTTRPNTNISRPSTPTRSGTISRPTTIGGSSRGGGYTGGNRGSGSGRGR